MPKKYDNERVSVITPVYNAARFIAGTVESAATQTYKDIEIVLVDDCSKDNSAEIIAKLQKKYSNIVYHKQEKKTGQSVANNVISIFYITLLRSFYGVLTAHFRTCEADFRHFNVQAAFITA